MNLSGLSKAAELTSLSERASHWRPGLAPARHNEIFASSREASGTGAALAFAIDAMRTLGTEETETRHVLWVQDAASAKLCGRPYRPGLPPVLRHRLIHVLAKTPEDALFALEEGLRCRDLACVMGEIVGNSRALDFTASRRLSLAAERHGIPLFLVRLDAKRDLSSARMRWQVRAAPSALAEWNVESPGAPRWHAELFRARRHPPGEWILNNDANHLAAERVPSTPDHGDLAAETGDRALAAV